MSDAQELQQFPCIYMFKIFGRRSDGFAEHVRDIVSATLGPIGSDSIKVRESAAGRYLSVSIVLRLDTLAQLERVYADLHDDGEVLFCI